ncbi:hypothetical protein SAMN04488005_0707 [Yoonia tamlensis]|uniref:Outer membrane protein OmpU n=1 Tax=Yoonia tamlensis TaxID=390270 RepID=A0A1I6FY07_9RHOB|nr:hypothetical protein [Yoonia tamlensis]SFR34781.1 hypothetical protein SAMN04488005_0707 [Yoonia tamlensis]
MTKHLHTSAIALALSLGATAATAEDSFYQGQVIELSAGIFAPLNTLQDTLTTPNGGGAQVQSTDALNFGLGPRIDVAYSRPLGNNARLIVDISAAEVTGDTTITIGATSETFPGSYDDGYQLPSANDYDTTVKTEMATLRVGGEWAINPAWRVSAGLQAGQAAQDLEAFSQNSSRNITSTSRNEMYGVFGGVSYYHGINDDMALRVSANLGVLENNFTYDYANIDSGGFTDQEASGTSSGTAYSAQIAARLERNINDHSMMIFEIGYEGLSGIGNGADTFLDAEGTASTAHIDEDMIGAAYISAGYALRF